MRLICSICGGNDNNGGYVRARDGKFVCHACDMKYRKGEE